MERKLKIVIEWEPTKTEMGILVDVIYATPGEAVKAVKESLDMAFEYSQDDEVEDGCPTCGQMDCEYPADQCGLPDATNKKEN